MLASAPGVLGRFGRIAVASITRVRWRTIGVRLALTNYN